jgi:hypothetical protein
MLTTVYKSVVSYFDLESRLKSKRRKNLLFGYTVFLVDCPIRFNLF